MGLASNALISVEDFKVYESMENSHLYRNALSVYGSDGTAATVAKSGNTLTLVKTGGANPGTTTFNLANASYDTLTELVAAINAVTGWVANLIGWSGAASTDLVNVSATSCLTVDNAVTLTFVDNYLIEQLINYCSDWVETFLRFNVKSATYTRQRYDGGGREIFLRNYPVSAVGQVSAGLLTIMQIMYQSAYVYNASVKITATGIKLDVDKTSWAELTFATYTTMKTMAAAINALSAGPQSATWYAAVFSAMYEDYPSDLLVQEVFRWARNYPCLLSVPMWPLDGVFMEDPDWGIITYEPGFPEGNGNVFITYTAGYSTVPDAIKTACLQAVDFLYKIRQEDHSMKSESLGDYSYTSADLEEALSPDALAQLKRLRRPLV